MSKGIDIRATTSELLFRTFLQDNTGAKIVSGTTSLSLYELQMSDGTLKSYDFNDNTFKATALTTETASMTHRTGNNGGTNTGLWTYRLATLTGFTAGNVYFASVNNTGASPIDQVREFQFGSDEGDLIVTSNYLAVDLLAINGNTVSPVILDRSARTIVRGTVGSASTTTSIVTSSLDPAAAVTDQFKDRVVIFDRTTTTVNLRGQAKDITASTSGGVLTVTALTTAPVSGDTFVIV